MGDGDVTFLKYVEADVYEETEAVRKSPRGMGEASVIGVEIRAALEDGGGVWVTIPGVPNRFLVPMAVLRAAIKIAPK